MVKRTLFGFLNPYPQKKVKLSQCANHQSLEHHFYRPQTKFAKLIFFTRVCLSTGWRGICSPGGAWSGGGLLPWGVPAPAGEGFAPGWGVWRPPHDGYCCGQYTSYWNAFLYTLLLLKECFIKMQHSKTNTPPTHPPHPSRWQNSMYVLIHLIPSNVNTLSSFYTLVCTLVIKTTFTVLQHPTKIPTAQFRHTLCRDYVVTKTIIVLCNEWNKDHYIQVNIIIRNKYTCCEMISQ